MITRAEFKQRMISLSKDINASDQVKLIAEDLIREARARDDAMASPEEKLTRAEAYLGSDVNKMDPRVLNRLAQVILSGWSDLQ